MYKLLIVDDNYIQIKSLIHYIKWENYSITEIKTAQDGKEGLEIYKSFRPDIVITDVVMPIMDGPQMTKEILKIGGNPQFIYISCYEDFGYLKSAMDNEVTSYILKPIDQKVLAESLCKAIKKIEKEKKYGNIDEVFVQGLDILRENFLYRIIYSKHINMEYLKSALYDLRFDRYKTFLAVRFEIIQEKDIYVNIYNLLNITKSNLLKNITGMVIIENETTLVSMLMSEQSNEEEFFNQVVESLKQHSDIVKKEYDITLNIGMSKVHSSFYDVHLMLSQASSALANNLFFNENGIYVYQEHDYISTDYNVVDLKESLDEIINNPSQQEINLFINTYCPEDIPSDKTRIKSLYVTTVAAIQLFLIEYNLDMEDVFGRADVMWHKLERFDNIKIFRQWLRNVIVAISEYINYNEKDKHENLVANIVDYINKNFRYISNIEQISSNFYISSSYARSIFKKYIGKTIFDYLIAVRMDEAQRLLSNPNSKVYEVAEMVGYHSKPHFVSTFKKYTGMNPSEFQQMMTEKGEKRGEE